MNPHETGRRRPGRPPASSATPRPRRSSALGCSQGRSGAVWRWSLPPTALPGLRAWACGQDECRPCPGVVGLHPEEVAHLQEEPVRRAAQVLESKRLGLRERRAIAQEGQRSRQGLVGEQQVVTEVVGHHGRCRSPAHQDRLRGARILERDLVLREVLAHVPEEDGARQLILDRKSTRLNSSHSQISYAVFCLKKKKKTRPQDTHPD